MVRIMCHTFATNLFLGMNTDTIPRINNELNVNVTPNFWKYIIFLFRCHKIINFMHLYNEKNWMMFSQPVCHDDDEMLLICYGDLIRFLDSPHPNLILVLSEELSERMKTSMFIFAQRNIHNIPPQCQWYKNLTMMIMKPMGSLDLYSRNSPWEYLFCIHTRVNLLNIRSNNK